MPDDNGQTDNQGSGTNSGGTLSQNPNEFIVPPVKTETPAPKPGDAVVDGSGKGSSTTASPATAAVPKLEELISSEYHDRAWVKDFARAEKPFDAMAKAYEGALEMSRKKDGIQVPGEGATPEQVEAFHKQIRDAVGVPADAEGYKLPAIEWGDDVQSKEIAEHLSGSRSPDFNKGVLKVLHDAGLSQVQVDKIWAGYEKLNVESVKKAMTDNEATVKAQESEFKQKFDKRFGADSKAVRERVAIELTKHVPSDLTAGIDSLNDEQLMAVAVFAEGLRKQYGREDKPFGRNDNQSPGDAKSLEQRRLELMTEREELIKKPGGRMSERYGQIETEMGTVRKQLGELYK